MTEQRIDKLCRKAFQDTLPSCMQAQHFPVHMQALLTGIPWASVISFTRQGTCLLSRRTCAACM